MGGVCCKSEPIDFTQDVELKHFDLQTAIGKGAFGKVKLVQHKLTKQKYALKYIDKKMCVEMKAVDCIIQERFLLEEIQSPFTCNLRYAFQDDENMFMVIDLMLGGDLRYLLNTKGNLSEDLIKFYMAECVLGIAYLHSKNIVHRDLKPDNILISETGHATLTDFNIATKYNPDKLMKSEAGSPAYMAPEMFIRKGYNNMIDYWSLGVIMYELLYGKRPFEANTSEGLKKAIISDEVAWKSTRELSADCKSAITEFLQKEWNVRMGGDEKVSKHAFFKDLDWDKLKRHEGVPPFIPDTKNINCDFTHELEEILVNDNPLVAKARKPGEKSDTPTRLNKTN
ncbi:AGC/YANK protein kinase [Rhizoclosmatium globosum]|uniref:non-specific serine/threonine protein kinase n=1 Tax=Rhizoclosmatium globosum TaxID=329046 RepID=A0A1Y2BP79_9FUNG|nr:AGC/YANK protein kinase [Rhizoclosmatium globosum]|eukprot:ORY36551.1 AGC/YANK protein kinase [Rhizoclosmatium globosum]